MSKRGRGAGHRNLSNGCALWFVALIVLMGLIAGCVTRTIPEGVANDVKGVTSLQYDRWKKTGEWDGYERKERK